MTRMSEESKKGNKPETPKINVPTLTLDDIKAVTRPSSSHPSSPVCLRKTTSVRANCLCSPTTHAGSFRCRYHRNSSLTRASMSVGSKLFELGEKSTD
ncbi:hypothetical protein ACS0TY_030788 [Phlomoides rotata]